MAIVVEISHPPYGHENPFAGLYVASAALSKGMSVVVILRGDGIYTARKGQEEPLKHINLPSVGDQISDIVDLDGRVIADCEALAVRGVEPSELIEGIEILDTDEIHDIILDTADKVVAF